MHSMIYLLHILIFRSVFRGTKTAVYFNPKTDFFDRIYRIETLGKVEIDQPQVGPKGELSGSEHMPAGAGWVACRRQPVGRHERERRRQPERSGAPSQPERSGVTSQPQRSGVTSQQCSLGWATEARRQTGNANHPQIAQIFAEG